MRANNEALLLLLEIDFDLARAGAGEVPFSALEPAEIEKTDAEKALSRSQALEA